MSSRIAAHSAYRQVMLQPRYLTVCRVPDSLVKRTQGGEVMLILKVTTGSGNGARLHTARSKLASQKERQERKTRKKDSQPIDFHALFHDTAMAAS